MTTGGGAPFGASVVGAAALVPFIATRAIVTARTTTSATAARAAGIRSKLVRAGAVVTEADMWFLQEWGSGAPTGRSALRRVGAGAPAGAPVRLGWVSWRESSRLRSLSDRASAAGGATRLGRQPGAAPAAEVRDGLRQDHGLAVAPAVVDDRGRRSALGAVESRGDGLGAGHGHERER